MDIAEHISIRKLKDTDIEDLARLANDKRIWNFVRDLFPSPYTQKDAELFIAGVLKQAPQENFALCYKAKLAGVMGVHPYSGEIRRCAEIGYWVGVEYWSLGIASACINWLVKYAFEQFEISRLEASAYSNNLASMRVLLKAGFHVEAVLKERIIKSNTILDEHKFVRFQD